MKQRTISFYSSLMLILLSFIIMMSSCSMMSLSKPKQIYWREVNGSVGTNDLNRLQKLVPFNIIIPKYLPKDLNNYNPDLGKTQGNYRDNETDIIIDYHVLGNPNSIHIVEANTKLRITPNEEADKLLVDENQNRYEYFIVGETSVLVHYININANPTDDQIKYFIFSWNNSELNILVTTNGYIKDESRKIIESMIK